MLSACIQLDNERALSIYMIHVYGSITCILHIIIVIIKPVIRHSYIKLTGVVYFTSQINTYDLPTLVINWQAIKCQ